HHPGRGWLQQPEVTDFQGIPKLARHLLICSANVRNGERMAGFLPILVASTGATPQAASDAPNQPTGADGVFAAVLSEVSGTAPAHGHGLPVADGPFALPQMAMPPAGSALQRLKLAFASPDALP